MKNKLENLDLLSFKNIPKTNDDVKDLIEYLFNLCEVKDQKDFAFELNKFLLSRGFLLESYVLSKSLRLRQPNKLLSLEILKSIYRRAERLLLKFELKKEFKNKTACLVGPSAKDLKMMSSVDFLILTKLYSEEHLSQFTGQKICLLWNGTASGRYLKQLGSLPEQVKYVLSKANRKNFLKIKYLNSDCKVYKYRTINRALLGDQSLVVDGIDLFASILREPLKVTGFDLRASGYSEGYKKIYQVHRQKENLLKTFYEGHIPYEDFRLIKDAFNRGLFLPDTVLRETLNLTTEDFLKKIELRLN